jgi:alkylation response protein AidB-like acyl-CoA dehydrogenase
MNLQLTGEQEEFRLTARKFLEAEAPLSAVRELFEDANGFDSAFWSQAADLGWTSAFVPEQYGGGTLSGRSGSDAVIIAEEMGRVVAPGPFLPSNVVATAVAAAGSVDQKTELLPRIAAGSTVATWALAEPGGVWSQTEPDIQAVADVTSGRVVLTGTKSYVESAAVADLFLVTARTGEGLTQVLVPAGAPGLKVLPCRSLDITRRFGSVSLDGVSLPESAVLGTAAGAGPMVERQLQVALALQCAETVGACDSAFTSTVDFARDRYAFGRPIASFQAIKHRIADMLQWLEFSKAIVDTATEAVDEERSDAGELVSIAKAYAGDRCLDIVDDCVQISGGIGVTWEHDVHLFSRRIAVNRALFGSPDQHRERLCCLLERNESL